MSEVYYFRIHGRGGQGGVLAAQLIVDAFDGPGVCQPKFGAERMGSPTQSYATVGKDKDLLRSNEQVYTPQVVGILDESLLTCIDVAQGTTPNGVIVINTKLSFERLKELLSRNDVNIAKVNATDIAMEVFGRPITNTAILGAIAKISPAFTLEQLEWAIKNTFKEDLAKKNIEVIKRAYNSVEIQTVNVIKSEKEVKKKPWIQSKPELIGYKDIPLGAIWYTPGGSESVNCGTWGTYKVEILLDKCIDCHRCYYSCPDLAIKRELGTDNEYHITCIDNYYCKGCRICYEICPADAIVYSEKKIDPEFTCPFR